VVRGGGLGLGRGGHSSARWLARGERALFNAFHRRAGWGVRLGGGWEWGVEFSYWGSGSEDNGVFFGGSLPLRWSREGTRLLPPAPSRGVKSEGREGRWSRLDFMGLLV